MSTNWNDFGGYSDQSLNLSSSVTFDPIDGAYGPTPLALQQQQQQQSDAYTAALNQHVAESESAQQSPMTAYSGQMDGGVDYGSPYATMSGGGSVNPAATMDMDYDLTGVHNVLGSSSMRNDGSMDSPMRSTSMTGLEGRTTKSQYGTTSAAEAFARLRAGSLSITPSTATNSSRMQTVTNSHQDGPVVTNGVPRPSRTSITDIPMRAFSYPARLPMSSQVSPRSSLSHSANYPLRSPVSSPFPTFETNFRSSNPTYDMYGTSANTAQSLNEGSLSGFNDGIIPSSTTTPTPETYQAMPPYPQQAATLQQPQPRHPAPGMMGPPALGPSMAPPSVYASSGFDLIGVLARVVGRKNPVINVGAIDMSCSFIVADAKAPDTPSIYVSETFCRLTGYAREEIVGRSCRFLQAPGDQPVHKGDKRRYTDTAAANHLRINIDALQECQVSLINYQKGGKPFINLVTCIPISWNNTGDIDYIVGFQVDLVDQPAAILDKMTNGSYVVNYSVVHATIARNPSVTSAEIASAIEQLEDTALQGSASAAAGHSQLVKPDSSTSVQSLREQVTSTEPGEVIDLVASNGLNAVANESVRKQFMRLMVDQCDDLIHVLSLKGALLYVSPAARKLLEYEPSELLGKTLASFCHPSDIVSVQRELKDAGMSTHASVNLVYRIRRKHSGYMWFEASGRLHLEQGKGRKCVILSGRPREVYKMSWQDLERAGGMGDSEFWAKVCVDGIFLTATRTTDTVFGLDSQQSIVGRSFADMSPTGEAAGVMQALIKAAEGTPSQVQHQMLGKDGPVDVVTHFYPARSDHEEPTSPTLPAVGQKQVSVIAQVNLLSSEMNKRNPPLTPHKTGRSGSQSEGSIAATAGSAHSGSVALALPAFGGRPVGSAPSTTSAKSSFSAVPSTFKSLASPSAQSDNVFDELNVTRGTSWQFELHQMRLTNKKLREEKEALSTLKRKREQSSKPSSTKGSSSQRACANCGRTSSAEWRSGPTGPKTLCNACGLRWSKARSQAQAAAAADVKKKAETAVAVAHPIHPVTKVKPGSSSDESRGGITSRESSSGMGSGTTNPTTNSPSSQSLEKAFAMQQDPRLVHSQPDARTFAPVYGTSLHSNVSPQQFGYAPHATH
ncbi:hypothetical protein JCM10212_002471 [Sporobolomyces blumeae]